MDDDQRKIIAEQAQANERIIRAVENRDQVQKNQAPVNERIKQLESNERTQQLEDSAQDSASTD